MLDRIAAAYATLLYLLMALSGVVICGVCVMILADVFMRLANLQPWVYANILVEYGLLWFAMLAAPWLARIKGHVYIDAITQLLPHRLQEAVAKLTYLICIVVSGAFSYFSLEVLVAAIADGQIDTRAADVPLWTLLLPIPFCFFLVTIEFVRFLLGYDSMYGDRTEARDNV